MLYKCVQHNIEKLKILQNSIKYEVKQIVYRVFKGKWCMCHRAMAQQLREHDESNKSECELEAMHNS